MLISCLLTFLFPIAAKTNFYLAVAARVALGVFHAVSSPAMQGAWGSWAPPEEKTKFVKLNDIRIIIPIQKSMQTQWIINLRIQCRNFLDFHFGWLCGWLSWLGGCILCDWGLDPSLGHSLVLPCVWHTCLAPKDRYGGEEVHWKFHRSWWYRQVFHHALKLIYLLWIQMQERPCRYHGVPCSPRYQYGEWFLVIQLQTGVTTLSTNRWAP